MQAYDFGPQHPLTPLRFGPGIDLLRALGADRLSVPPVATQDELARLHQPDYIRDVLATSVDPSWPRAAGVGSGDVPAFEGMHEAAARIVGGSVGAVTEILEGRASHAFNPAGGLHHAMAGRASGFCVYNDVALAVAAARDAGHRVLYVDLDVHHGDGTEALFWDDPEVLTVSVHESGTTLFPGTGNGTDMGGAAARGSAVNVPLEAGAGDATWWPVVRSLVTSLAAAFRPTFLVSQHGCDTHATDPLAHLRVTTAAYARACALLDGIAHDECGDRWLATGGGGYDAYRVVPRSWALVWLAQAHLEVPALTPAPWRARWAAAAEEYGQAPPPAELIDPPGTVAPDTPAMVDHHVEAAARTVDAAIAAMSSR